MEGKRIPLLVGCLLLLLVVQAAFAQVIPPLDAFKVDLIADGGGDGMKFDAGDVFIWIDDDIIFVQFRTQYDWLLDETHVHIDSSGDINDGIDDIPTNKKGLPKNGRFEYKASTVSGVSEYTYSEPLQVVDGDGKFFIAAQAVVTSETHGSESAWGDGERFNNNANWAMYIIYQDFEELSAELGMDIFYSRDPHSFALWGEAVGGVAPYNYSWDLDDDGLFDDAYGDSIVVDGTSFWPPDSYDIIGFRVQDSIGNVAYDSATAYLLDLT